MKKIRIACLFFILSFLLMSSFQVLLARIDSPETKTQNVQLTELENIQLLIKKRGLKWNAGLTDVAMRSDEEKEKMLGGSIPDLGPDVKQVFIQTTHELPAHFDWRDKDGIDWMTPVKDQGGCGSCWAFAAVGATEAKFNIYNNNPNLDLDLSEQQMVSNGDVCCTDCGDCTSGGYPSRALNYTKYTGLVDETCFPYTGSNSQCNLCYNWQSRLRKIKDYFWVKPNTIDAYKTALIDYGPLVVELNADEDIFYYIGGIYEPTGVYASANHAVVLVGYDDAESYWIVKNSFGTGWGENGYGKVAYGSIEKYDYVLAVNETDLVTTCSCTDWKIVDEDEYTSYMYGWKITCYIEMMRRTCTPSGCDREYRRVKFCEIY